MDTYTKWMRRGAWVSLLLMFGVGLNINYNNYKNNKVSIFDLSPEGLSIDERVFSDAMTKTLRKLYPVLFNKYRSHYTQEKIIQRAKIYCSKGRGTQSFRLPRETQRIEQMMRVLSQSECSYVR